MTILKNKVKTRRKNDAHKLTDHSKDLTNPKINLKNNYTEERNDAFEGNDMQKWRQNQKEEWRSKKPYTDHSKDLRNHRSKNKRI